MVVIIMTIMIMNITTRIQIRINVMFVKKKSSFVVVKGTKHLCGDCYKKRKIKLLGQINEHRFGIVNTVS